MSGPSPSAVKPRPGGGFSQNFGNFSDEHLDESAMQQLAQQKSLQQQASTAAQSAKPGAQPSAQNPLAGMNGLPTGPQAPPREVGTLVDELIRRPAADIVKGLKSLFDINTLLGINTQDTPEQQARKQQLHQRYQQLTQEQQQVAQKKYQTEMQKKKQEKELEEQKKMQEEQKKRQTMVVPKSTKKGPIGPASGTSKKANTAAMLEQDRKTLGNAGKKF